MSFTTVLAIGIAAFVVYKWGGKFNIPPTAWKVIGGFFLICVIWNANSAYAFVTQEAENWWPVIEDVAHKLSEGFRDLITHISEGKEG